MKIASLEKVNGVAWFFGGVVLWFLISLFFEVDLDLYPDDWVWVYIILAIIFVIIFPIWGYNHKNKRVEEQLAKLNLQVDTLNDELMIHLISSGRTDISKL